MIEMKKTLLYKKSRVLLVLVLLALSFLSLSGNLPPVKASDGSNEFVVDSYTDLQDALGNIEDHHPSDSARYSAYGQAFNCTYNTETFYYITRISFSLAIDNYPTGTAYIRLYATNQTFGVNASATGDPLATSDPVDVSLLPHAVSWVNFTFSTQYQVAFNETYAIVFEAPASGTIDATDRIQLMANGSTPIHEGNTVRFRNGVWETTNAMDLRFYVYGRTPRVTEVNWQKCIRWQSKAFYTQGLYWVFYVNGTDGEDEYTAWLYYTTSSDRLTWATPTNLTINALSLPFYLYGEVLAVELTDTHFHLALKLGPSLTYRRGTPNATGLITWDSAWHQFWNAGGTHVTDHYLAIDSEGYPWVTWVYGNGYPAIRAYVSKSAYNNGTYVHDTGYPLQLSSETRTMTASIVSLSNERMYAMYFYGSVGERIKGRLYDGTSWLAEEYVTTNPIQPEVAGESWSYDHVVDNDDSIHLVWFISTDIRYVKRDFNTGWTSEELLVVHPEQYASPQITIDPDTNILYVFYANTTNEDRIHYLRYVTSWDSSPTVWIDESKTAFAHNGTGGTSGILNVNFSNDHLLVLYLIDSPITTLFYLRLAEMTLDSYAYSFFGLYDEDTGLWMDASNRAVNVTAYFTTATTSASFEVNGSYLYTPSLMPLYFHFDLTNDREYWLSTDEISLTIYIFEGSTSVYTISFLDLAGVCDDRPFVRAQRYVNGTLRTIEKRRVDVEDKISASLVQGIKYNILIEDESTSYTYGDLLVTSVTLIELTLKGIDFSKETLLTYANVRIYGTRTWGLPNGNITITYEDLLEVTNSVDIYINYKNGTNAYNATENADSFIHTWTSALNNTDYVVICEIDHTRYGEYEWRQYFPRSHSEAPWGLDFLGDSLPFNSNLIIPMLLIIFVAGCFSRINAQVGAFMAVVTAGLLTYMGWIPIPAGALIFAFALAILMAIVYSKRKVQVI